MFVLAEGRAAWGQSCSCVGSCASSQDSIRASISAILAYVILIARGAVFCASPAELKLEPLVFSREKCDVDGEIYQMSQSADQNRWLDSILT